MSDKKMDLTVFKQLLAEFKVPENLWEGLWNYYLHGISAGSFLDAVLRNDLRLACGKSDSDGCKHLWNICAFLYNHFPMAAWGSNEAVDRWIATHTGERTQAANG